VPLGVGGVPLGVGGVPLGVGGVPLGVGALHAPLRGEWIGSNGAEGHANARRDQHHRPD
jgi:hypothetical protein